MAKKNEREKLSIDEEMLMWTSYRYCIGRKTYVSALASYIGKKYYNLLSDERAEFTAKDIRRCINDSLRFGNPSFEYEGSVMDKERDALSDFLGWLNDNVESSKDLIDVDTIKCYKESYKEDAPKKFFTVKKHSVRLEPFETDFSDLLIWHELSCLFDKKKHKLITIEFEGEEKTYECFEAWEKVLEPYPGDKRYLKEKPWKYKKGWVSVENYLKCGEHAGRLNEDYIVKIEDIK